MVAGSVTSQWPSTRPSSSLANGSTRFFSASPCQVSAISAPAAWQALAMPQAIERLLATPRINPRLPCISLESCVIRFPIDLDRLPRYTSALARDADIADDLVQDTLVRALRSERLFLGGDVRSWLYTILTNLNKNRRRSLARRPQFMPLLDNNPDASGTEAESRDIARALATLVEEQRAVLLLVMLEGLSYREVADIQGVPIGTVMSRLARARAHVKASLEGERPTLRRVK